MLRLDGSAPPKATTVTTGHRTRNLFYDNTDHSFTVDGAAVPLNLLGRHVSLTNVAPAATHDNSPLQVTDTGTLYVANGLYEWASRNPQVVTASSKVMQESYNALFKDRTPHGATGFSASVMRRKQDPIGMAMQVPDFAGMQTVQIDENWSECVFTREAASSVQRAALRSGIGYIAYQMCNVQEPVATT